MLIAVPLSDRNFRERLLRVREGGADAVELRVDLFERTDADHVEDLGRQVRDLGLKLILTVRIPEEGGRRVPNRREIFERVAPVSDFTDIELRERPLIPWLRRIVSEGGGRLIVSYHNFKLTPASWVLREILREGHRFGGIPKIAVRANSLEDVARLLCTGAQEKYHKILIAMGGIGSVSRIAGFVFGSLITYASLDEPSAPGQLSLEDTVKLRELFYK
ncbi:MAG TPA: type I 3-dehydroquinate dehydratase [Aquifex aeolicus]|uniref:3-dehydroquinate dehydratase n=1 Tax=Aquifex aeolicus TaxID=63363 RepID=A0A7C5L7D5_AQUAO|nr:type I 3-dehydroquinate dehydratase [Aquifex aeolicus]